MKQRKRWHYEVSSHSNESSPQRKLKSLMKLLWNKWQTFVCCQSCLFPLPRTSYCCQPHTRAGLRIPMLPTFNYKLQQNSSALGRIPNCTSFCFRCTFCIVVATNVRTALFLTNLEIQHSHSLTIRLYDFKPSKAP